MGELCFVHVQTHAREKQPRNHHQEDGPEHAVDGPSVVVDACDAAQVHQHAVPGVRHVRAGAILVLLHQPTQKKEADEQFKVKFLEFFTVWGIPPKRHHHDRARAARSPKGVPRNGGMRLAAKILRVGGQRLAALQGTHLSLSSTGRMS
jgi:hypothetical protein